MYRPIKNFIFRKKKKFTEPINVSGRGARECMHWHRVAGLRAEIDDLVRREFRD